MCAVCKDHPRGCGENVFIRVKRAERNGSPPRMRGKLGQNSNGVPLIRITPADAGKTSYRILCAFHIQDHPRGCGENYLRWLAQHTL